MARPDVNQLDFHAIQIEHVSFIEYSHRQRQIDPAKVVVLLQLSGNGQRAGMEGSEHQARKKMIGPRQQFSRITLGSATCALRSDTDRWAMISAPAKSWLPQTWSPSSCVLTTRFGMRGHTLPKSSIIRRACGRSELGVDHHTAARLMSPEFTSHTRFLSLRTAKQLSLTCCMRINKPLV